MIFYVTLSGTRGMPKRFIENVMVSAGSLWSIQCGKFIRRNPPAHTRFFLDSGGFNCLNRFGNYPWSRSDNKVFLILLIISLWGLCVDVFM